MRRLIRRLARVAVPPLVAAGLLATPGVAGAASVTCQGWTGGQPADPGGLTAELSGVAVISSCDVWAVGDFEVNGGTFPFRTLAEHWTGGSSWTQVPTQDPSSAGDEFFGVSAVGAGNIWAVGQQEDSPGALIEHWNGSAKGWSVVPSHAPAGSTLQAVAAVSATNAWAVGASTDTQFVSHPLIEHWNGTRWSALPPPAKAIAGRLDGLAAVSATDIWAVGSTDGTSNTRSTLIEHWNGTSWKLVPSPSQGVFDQLTAVSADSTADAWAVGSTEASAAVGSQPMAEHWNGTAWQVVPSASFPGTTGAGLSSVHIVSPTDAWAVGSEGLNNVPFLLHWDGTGWFQQPQPDTGLQALGGGPARGNVWAAGVSDQGTASAEPLAGIPHFEAVVNQANQALGEFGVMSGHPPGAAKVAAGSSPSVATHDGGPFEAAWRATNGDLWTVDSSGHVADAGVKVAAGTSPSVAAIGSGSFAVAFVNAAGGTLWEKIGASPPVQVGTALVAPGTSPAITGDLDGEFEIAFQAAGTGDLTVAGTGGIITGTGAKMAAGSSPAMTTLSVDQFETAFARSDGTLWAVDPDGTIHQIGGDLPVAPGTSPAISAGSAGFVAAVQHAGTRDLVTVTVSGGPNDTHQVMAAGTSPAVAILPSGAFQFAYQAAGTSHLDTLLAGQLPFDTGLVMAAGTSPTIAGPG